MLNFLKSGKSNNFAIKVFDSETTPDPDAIKICDIIVCKNKKFDETMTLKIIPSELIGSTHYDLSGSQLFCMLSPGPDPQMRSRNQREVLLINGPSGAGKSTFAAQYCRSWQRTIKQRIIMFSAVEEDIAFESIKMKRIPFDKLVDDDGQPNDCIQLDDLKDSLCIFDDIDMIANKKLRIWMQDLRNRCLEVGRHKNISIISVNHELMNYRETKIIHTESNKIVLFPNSGSGAQIKRYLISYIGMSNDEIKRVFALKSRWVMISKSAPRYVMSANEAYLL